MNCFHTHFSSLLGPFVIPANVNVTTFAASQVTPSTPPRCNPGSIRDPIRDHFSARRGRMLDRELDVGHCHSPRNRRMGIRIKGRIILIIHQHQQYHPIVSRDCQPYHRVFSMTIIPNITTISTTKTIKDGEAVRQLLTVRFQL